MSKAIPKYRKHSSGQAFVQHKSIPTSDHRMYLGKHGTEKSMRRYRQFLEQLEQQRKKEIAGKHKQLNMDPSKEYSILQLIDAYISYAETYHQDDGEPTQEFYQMKVALRPLADKCAETLANKFGPKTLQTVREYMIDDLDLARSTINNRIRRIKTVFKWATAEELIDPSVYHGLLSVRGLMKGKSGAKEAPKVTPVPIKDVNRTLPNLSDVVATMVKTQLLCGMRPQDVTRMRAVDIDMKGDVWLYSPFKHKNSWRGQNLVKAIPQFAQPLLTPYLDREPDAWFFSPRESYRQIRHRRPPVRMTDQYKRGTYYQAIQYGIQKTNKLAVEAGTATIDRWSPNRLRHTIGTLLSQSLDQQKAQRWLGHQSLDTTAIYTAIETSELIQIARTLDKNFPAAVELFSH